MFLFFHFRTILYRNLIIIRIDDSIFNLFRTRTFNTRLRKFYFVLIICFRIGYIYTSSITIIISILVRIHIHISLNLTLRLSDLFLRLLKKRLRKLITQRPVQKLRRLYILREHQRSQNRPFFLFPIRISLFQFSLKSSPFKAFCALFLLLDSFV